jgi:hypothetical protein
MAVMVLSEPKSAENSPCIGTDGTLPSAGESHATK